MNTYTVIFRTFAKSRKNIIVKTEAQNLNEVKDIIALAFVAAEVLFKAKPKLIAVWEV